MGHGENSYVIHGVHGNTTSLGPRVALDSELVLGARSLCRQLLANLIPRHLLLWEQKKKKKTY